ncbi:hypothetical protein [Mycoplasmopsis gallopavonis]|uniref:Uncharacterized protein n=1 Tax=Mycoplasmopsis gallopavonis TaxID=76629 RepID=A0A449B0G6_9BACT|nr:hypothetical protein [Mycoplasmopsis gallopavonis]RIV16558.1 hypothetical protein D1113_01855 [Mycoplasmopsis gallopavonis]VEU73239.1 Uncharacterised protein [Mycoplasmopsis gallopavonis]
MTSIKQTKQPSLTKNKTLSFVASGVKGFTLLIFLGLILFTLFSLDKLIGSQVNTNNKSYLGFANLFNFSNLIFKSRNFAVLYTLIIFNFTWMYALYSSYRLWRYSLKFKYTLFLILSFWILAFITFGFMFWKPIGFETKPIFLLYEAVPFLVTLLINFGLELFIFIRTKKQTPS